MALSPSARRSLGDVPPGYPSGSRRRVLAPCGDRRPGDVEGESSLNARQRVQPIISDQPVTHMLLAIADSADDAVPGFLEFPSTDDGLVVWIRKEVDRLDRFGCIDPIAVADASGDSVILTRWVYKRKGPNEVVAEDYDTGDKCDDTLAATPTPEGRFIINLFAVKRGWRVVLADVSMFFFGAPCCRRAVVCPLFAGGSARQPVDHVVDILAAQGFGRGNAGPTVFLNRNTLRPPSRDMDDVQSSHLLIKVAKFPGPSTSTLVARACRSGHRLFPTRTASSARSRN